MLILGIESSCDETAVAIVENGTHISSSVTASSQEMQALYGGVFPEQAAREQVRTIIPTLEKALSDAFPNQPPQAALACIDAIAVTYGPGLIGSLLIGVETAKTLAYLTRKPIIPTHHLLGHIYASWLSSDETPKLPALCLIVSGGHTILAIMQNHSHFQVLGQTRDDAAGEAFDKTARLLQLSYPGGPAIQQAATGVTGPFNLFPRPMLHDETYDFSFSGLKTAVLREVQKQVVLNDDMRSHLAANIQEAIVDVLCGKILRALEAYDVRSIIIGGGVAANARLHAKLHSHIHTIPLFIPPPALCTDNAAAIAAAAYFNHFPKPWHDVSAIANLAFPPSISRE